MSLELREAGLLHDGRWLVRDASIAARPGRLLAIVGPNGSGKSTLLRLLAGVWRPTAGAALLDGTPLPRLSRREIARRVSLVPQETHLAFAFSVREVVSMGRHPHLGRFTRERSVDRAAIDAALERTDLQHLADRGVHELSGGERQRVLIARSLATEAAHILLDEPTANLDVAHALDLLTLCRALADEGRAVVIVLHDLNSALRLGGDVALLKEGSVAAVGAAADVLTAGAVEQVFAVRASLAKDETGESLLYFRPRRPGTRPGGAT